jgi:S-adenosylmethionine/arginine decarboxylase-like enzyme
MTFLSRIAVVSKSRSYKEKVLELATEFLLEASILSGVLGVLESAISVHGWPSLRAITWSIGFAVFFFLCACMIQIVKEWRTGTLDVPEESST